MVENVHFHLKALLDPIDKTAVSVNVKSLLESWLVKHCAWSSTRLFIGVADLTMHGKDYNGEKESVRSQAEMESQWEADGMFLGKTGSV